MEWGACVFIKILAVLLYPTYYYMNMNNCNIARMLLIVAAIFIATCIPYLGFLSTKLYKHITGWSITHIIWFFIMGYLCPGHIQEFMLMGILWEVLEKIIGILTGKEKFWTSGGTKGQITDLIMNYIGYVVGEYVKKK